MKPDACEAGGEVYGIRHEPDARRPAFWIPGALSLPETYLLGIDLGAGSLKATLITPEGVVKAEAGTPISTRMRHFGWAEQDPAEWYAAL
ncbi:MAG: hypothetical protein KGH75_12455, partial [Rhodospirillales bacterium]|nr:hypothetical protein [Rhodospirillales bacterium]